MHFPARNRAENQRGPLAVAGGDIAHPVEGTALNEILARTTAAPAHFATQQLTSVAKMIDLLLIRDERRECRKR
jgi:hypothetical protein